jgi:hypothetical protein
VAFIDAHRGRFGVEPICRVLSEHGCKIAPNTYWVAKKRPPSARTVRDEVLKVDVKRVHLEALDGVYGADKVWGAAQPGGHPGGTLHRRAPHARDGPVWSTPGPSLRSPPAPTNASSGPLTWWSSASRLRGPTGSGSPT